MRHRGLAMAVFAWAGLAGCRQDEGEGGAALSVTPVPSEMTEPVHIEVPEPPAQQVAEPIAHGATLDRFLAEIAEIVKIHENGGGIEDRYSKLALDIKDSQAELIRAGPEARDRLFREVAGWRQSTMGEQNVVLMVKLALAEAALMAGDLRQCYTWAWSVAESQFGVELGTRYAEFFSAERWMYRIRASIRAADACRLGGAFDVALMMAGRARETLDGPEPPHLTRSQRAAQELDLQLALADIQRLLGRIGDVNIAMAEARSLLSVVENAASELGDLAGPLRERYSLTSIESQMLMGQFDRAAKSAIALVKRMDARGADAGEIATVRVRQAIAEMGLFRTGQASHRVPATTLGDVLREPESYPSTRRQALLKLLDLCIAVADWGGAASCLERLEPMFEGGAELRSAELVALRSMLRREGQGDGAAPDVWSQLDSLAAAWSAAGGEAGPQRGGTGFLAPGWRRVVLSEWIHAQVGSGVLCTERDRVCAALRGLLKLESATALARTRCKREVGVDEVVEALVGEDRGLLVYLPARFGSHLFVLSPGHFEHRSLPTEIDLVASLAAFAGGVRTRPDRIESPETLLDLGREIRERLLPSAVLQRLESCRAVTVVGADYLSNLPFEALPLGEELLGERFAIGYLESASLGVGLMQSRNPLPKKVGMLACTQTAVESPDVQSEPFRVDWAQGVVDVYGSDVLIALDREASLKLTLDVFREGGYGVLHVVAHGVRRWTSQFSNGVAMADGPLWPNDLFDIPVQGLVVLSACSAARGEVRLGEGALLTNLGGTLLWQGATAVVMPQAPIPVAPHLRMMAVFHRELSNGLQSPAAALQRARAALRDDGGWAQRINRATVQVHGLGVFPVW